MTNYKKRLSEFRQALKREHVDAFIIPQADMWQSEQVEAHDNRLNFICGLKASAGYCVITKDKAVVLIDHRYTVSAKEQIDGDVFDIAYYTDTMPEQWAIEHLPEGSVLGYDPWLHTRRDAKRMQKACNAAEIILTAVKHNPVDSIWHDRPVPTDYTAINHDLKFAGLSVEQKMEEICKRITNNQADSAIITAPDSIAWMLNLRTIENTQSPGIRGFAIVQCQNGNITVFTDVDCTAFAYSQTEHFEVDFLPLEEFPMAIAHFERIEQTVQISEHVPDWLTEHLNAPASKIITRPDPCTLLKACKNETEQKGIRESHIRDAKAVKHVIDWIKQTPNLTEREIADELIKQRAKSNMFRGVSFDSIVGWNANGAKIHGAPTDTLIKGNGLLLIDSGGQYDDGTTDITRTIAVGTPSDDMCEKYTLVLKAHIALATAIFPEGTTGAQLDALVRAPLWAAGLDFKHGTGHGVGHFLNVHEGPCNISPRGTEPLKEGMLLSNEPGCYKEGHYGIRLENLILVQRYKEADDKDNETGKLLLRFETVTHVPFDEACILWDRLTQQERNWLEAYQQHSHAV